MKRYLLVTMMTILAFGLAVQSDMYSCFWKKKAKPAPSTNIEQSDIKSGSETQSSSQGHAQAGLQPVSYLAGGVNSFAF
ncbi:MAG: hypothetical protein PHI68_06105, partial [Candidatus Cloacimonetes bacterium]|nr:hypothetical protein [Candidatus Cloacimonadota bacterium]